MSDDSNSNCNKCHDTGVDPDAWIIKDCWSCNVAEERHSLESAVHDASFSNTAQDYWDAKSRLDDFNANHTSE
jgi:hypothetical protein